MASKTVGTGVIRFRGDNSEFKRVNDKNVKGLNKMAQGFKRNQTQMRKFNSVAGKVKGQLAAMAAGFASVFGARFLKDKIRELADFAAGVYESSVRLGVHTEFLQAWQRAFEGESGTIAGADKALEKFTKAVYDSRREIRRGNFDTGTYSDTFKQLGLTAEQVKNLRIEQLLGLVAKGMKDLNNATDVTGSGLFLFGIRGKSAINVLMDGLEEFRRKMEHFKGLGTLDLAQSQSLKEISQAFVDLGNVTRVLMQKVVVKYKDQIIEFIYKLMELSKAAAAAFDTHFNTMAAIAGKLAKGFGLVIELIPRLKAYVTALAVVIGVKFVYAIGAATAAVWLQVGAWKALKWAIARTGIGLLVIAIGEAVYWFTKLTEAAGGFKGALITIWEAIKQVFEKAFFTVEAYYKFTLGVYSSIAAAMTRAMATGLGAVIDLVNDSRRWFAGLKGAVSALFSNIGQIIKGVFVDSGKSISEVMQEGFDEAFDSIEDKGTSAVKAIEENAKEASEKATQYFTESGKAWEQVTSGFRFSQIPEEPKGRGSRRGGRHAVNLEHDPTAGGDDLTGGAGGDTSLDHPALTGMLPKLNVQKTAYYDFRDAVRETNMELAKGFATIGSSVSELTINGEFQLHKLRTKGLEVAADIAQKFADDQIWEPFQNKINDLLNKLTDGILNAMEGTDGGFSLSGLFTSSAASGGRAQRGMPVRVNERQKGEIFVPNQNGRILNPQQQRNMAGQGQVVIAPTINTDNPDLVKAVLAQEVGNLVRASRDDATYQASRPGTYRTAIRG